MVRGSRTFTHSALKQVQPVVLGRAAEEAKGTFGAKIRDLAPDCVIDLTAYTLESTQTQVEALRGCVQQFLHCGTIWMHGPSVEVHTCSTKRGGIDFPQRCFIPATS